MKSGRIQSVSTHESLSLFSFPQVIIRVITIILSAFLLFILGRWYHL